MLQLSQHQFSPAEFLDRQFKLLPFVLLFVSQKNGIILIFTIAYKEVSLLQNYLLDLRSPL